MFLGKTKKKLNKIEIKNSKNIFGKSFNYINLWMIKLINGKNDKVINFVFGMIVKFLSLLKRQFFAKDYFNNISKLSMSKLSFNKMTMVIHLTYACILTELF